MTIVVSGFARALQRLEFEHKRELALLHGEIHRLHREQPQEKRDDDMLESPRATISSPLFSPTTAQKDQGLDGSSPDTFHPALRTSKSSEAEKHPHHSRSVSALSIELAETEEGNGATPHDGAFSSEGSDSPLRSMHSTRSKIEILQAEFKLRPLWCSSSAEISLGERGKSSDMTTRGPFLPRSPTYDLFRSGARANTFETNFSQATRAMIYKCCHSMMIRPGSRKKFFWDTSAMLALCFDLFWIPMQVFNPEQTLAVCILQWGCLGIWTLDMLMSVITGYCTKEGVVVMSFRKSLWRYLRTWFAIDVVIVGLDWFLMLRNTTDRPGAASARVIKVVRFARMLRTMRLLRLLKLREFFYAARQMLDTELAGIVFGMVFNVFMLLALSHAFACFWFWLGKHGEDGWVAANNGLKRSIQWQYFTSVHWTLTQFTPAAMEITPETGDERVFAVGMLVFGLIVFSSFLSSVTAGVSRLRNLQEVKVQQRYELRRFLNENHISSSLGVRISRYIDIVQQVRAKKIDMSEVTLLQWLSGPLRVELQTELYGPSLIEHEVFWIYDQKSRAALSQICFQAVSTSHLSKHDVLFSSFSSAHFMYLITDGSMVYTRTTQMDSRAPKQCYIQEGQFISEQTLWVVWIHRGEMAALTHANAMDVKSETFGQLTRQQPEVFAEMQAYAMDFVQKMSEETADHGIVFDVSIEYMLKHFHTHAATINSLSQGHLEVIQAENMEMMLIGRTVSAR